MMKVKLCFLKEGKKRINEYNDDTYDDDDEDGDMNRSSNGKTKNSSELVARMNFDMMTFI